MQFSAFAVLVGALSTLGTVVPAIGQAGDDSEMLARIMKISRAPSKPKDSHLPGLLYPRESQSREVKSLDGLWDFAVVPTDDARLGHRESWFGDDLFKSTNVMQMPVPSSYNDVTTSTELRDHIGVVWYERSFFVPISWSTQRIFIRFGSVNYLAEVWINGHLVAEHEMGHLPFEAEISEHLLPGSKNRVTVAVDNSLLPTSVPQGEIYEANTDTGPAHFQTYTFDFFNYAGIHRPVLLHTKPRVYVEDITVETTVIGTTGIVNYTVQVGGLREDEVAECTVILREGNGSLAVGQELHSLKGRIEVPTAKLWWPIGMSTKPAYLYELEVTVTQRYSADVDVYSLPVGIRSLRWTNTSILFNEMPLYLRGFGRHEDSEIRGRGLDLVTMTRDYELLKWVGANSYRTSHYPYSDEVLDMADRQGILIIDECPAVDVQNYSPELRVRHKASLSELIRRDKNRPSVIMWSIANEPKSSISGSEEYYRKIARHTKTLDPTRPITAALATNYAQDKAAQFLDVIGFNRYNSWYSNPGRLNLIINKVVEEAVAWNKKYDKPIMILEYGGDTMPGLHELPSYIWSEEYQKEMFSRHFMAFDRLRRKGFFVGEFIWNFADFRTSQTYTRVGGNKKGIFTRSREPKLVAHHVRKRYHTLGKELNGVEVPLDLDTYVTGLGYSAREEVKPKSRESTAPSSDNSLERNKTEGSSLESMYDRPRIEEY